MVSVMSAAESTEVVKKMTTRMIETTEVTRANGKFSRNANSAPGMSPSPTTRSTRPPSPFISMSMEPVPKMPNQITLNVAGTASTPSTNSRTVRRREIRAMNNATHGAQEVGQAAADNVQLPGQPGHTKGACTQAQ